MDCTLVKGEREEERERGGRGEGRRRIGRKRGTYHEAVQSTVVRVDKQGG